MQSRKRSGAVERGLMGVHIPSGHKPIVFLHAAGVEALLTACRNYAPRYVRFGTERNLALLYLAVFAGLRVNELHMLDVGDIDFDARSVHVRFGKGSKGKGPKERWVPLNQDAMAVVERYISVRGWPGLDEPLFISSRGRLARRTIQWLVRKLGDEVEIQTKANKTVYHLSPHKLRHTFASLLAAQNTPLIEIKELLGHSSTRTTEIYAHAHEGHKAVDALSKKKTPEPTLSDLMAKLAELEQKLEEK